MADKTTQEENALEAEPIQPFAPQREEAFRRESYSGGSPLEQMILALSDEIDFAQHNARKQTLKNGERVGELGGLHLYSFPLDRAFDFEADEDVAVAIGGHDYRGRIVRIELASVVIGIDEHRGEALARVDITRAEDIIEKLLRKQLAAVFEGKSPGFNKGQADYVIGQGEPESDASSIPELVDKFLSAKGFALNPEQQTFISKALASELTLLWGPPGCGKTLCIGLLTACLLAQNKRVLLASNTNKAVDGALHQVLQTKRDINEETDDGTIIRFSGAGITDEFKRDWPSYLLDEIQRKRGGDLEAEKSKLQAEQSARAADLAKCEQGLEIHEGYRQLQQRRSSAPREINECQAALEGLRRQMSELEQVRGNLEAEWADAPETPTLVSRLTRKRPREEIEAQRLQCQDQVKRTQVRLEERTQRLAALKHERTQLEKLTVELTERLKRIRSESDLKSQQQTLRSRLSELETRLREIDQALGDLRRSILSEARLIGTTVHKTFLDPLLSSLEFDAVIVDEASMVVLPMIYWAAGRAKAQVIVVGDFQQLPAIIKNMDGELAKEWLACSPFDKWHVPNAVQKGSTKDLPFLVALQEQNRMHPEIGRLVSDLFYSDIHTPKGNGLLPGPRAKSQASSSQRLPQQKTDKRIITIDTRDLGGWSSQPYEGSGRFNPTHVALGLALIDRFALAGVLEAGENSQVGFVTPYAGQARLFTKAAEQRHHDFIDQTSIGTAHRFQGGERDIIIFDYVLSENRRYPSRFIDSINGHDQPANLLNVALSRAKKHLIVIYNSDDFGERCTHPWMRNFFQTLVERSEALDAKQLLQESDVLGQVRELVSGRAFTVEEGNTLHDETSFYAAVRTDLVSAQQAVLIFSAFATPENVARWADLFQSMLERGVRIRVVTKPARSQPNAQRNSQQLMAMFDTLRRAGIVIDTRSATHEKAVVIDNKIVWHGSLNMLSQNVARTTELMTRTVSSQYASELLRMLARHDLKQQDLTLQQLPVCPTCSGPTTLGANWKGQRFLFCEQDCGFIAAAWDFHKLARGLPIGKHLHRCPACRSGSVVVAQTKRGRTYGRCNSSGRRGGPKCKHQEELRLTDLPAYEPYPEPKAPEPSILAELTIEAADTFASPPSARSTVGEVAVPSKKMKKQDATSSGRGPTSHSSEGPSRSPANKTSYKTKPSPSVSRSKQDEAKKGRRRRPKDAAELDAYLSSLS